MASWGSPSRPSSSPSAYLFLLLLTHITSVPRSGLPVPNMAGTRTLTKECISTQTIRHLRRYRSSGAKGEKFLREYRLVSAVPHSTCANPDRRSVEQSNVAVAVVGVVVCVSRWSLIWCRYRLGCIELLYDILLSFLWYASLSGQTASDLSDHDHLSTRPWYLRKECGAVKPPAKSACALMQAQWAVSIFML